MGSHKHNSGSSTRGPSRSSTAPPERQSRRRPPPRTTLAPLDETYEPLDAGFQQSSSSSSNRAFTNISDLYAHVVTTAPPDQGGSSSSRNHGKRRSSHRSSQQRYGTPAPESFRSQGFSSSQSAWSPPAPSASWSSRYSESVDRAEAAAMQNTQLFQGDGSYNPMLEPFVATEGEEQPEPEQFWVWNPVLQRYTHEGTMLCPKPDSLS